MSTTAILSRRTSIAVGLSPMVLVVLASALAWGILFAAFAPAQQNFPLNDDWAFARGAFLFARGEGIHYSNWASMPQLGQWLWACPFLWLMGESFFALRMSTIALSWLGLWAFYDLLRQEGHAPTRSAFATAALAFNPLFFLLQGTFMTDVPALALALAALALYGRALRSGRSGWLAAACATAILAGVTRQNTVSVSLTAAVLLWCEQPLRRRLGWWLAVLTPVIAAFAVHLWFQQRPDVRPMKPELIEPPALLQLPFVAIHFCGLSALPLLLCRPRFRPGKTFALVAGLMAACAGYWLLYGVYLPYGGMYPYTENMLTPLGAFAGSRSTGLLVVGNRPLVLGIPMRVLLSLLGVLAGALLVMRGLPNGHPTTRWNPLVFFTLFQLPFLLIVPGIYDRYLLFLLPGALAFALPPAGTKTEDALGWPRVGLGFLVVFAGVSLALMHDWLSWNAARWELGRRAVSQRHIDPRSIEGGVEWDGWYAGVGGEPMPSQGRRWPVLPFSREWFPSISGQFALSFSEMRGARRLDAEPYSLWLAPGPQQFFLLELAPLPRPAPKEESARNR